MKLVAEPRTTYGLTATERRIIELIYGRQGLRLGGPLDEKRLMTVKEAARILGIGQSSVSNRLKRARGILYSSLADMEKRAMLAPRRRVLRRRGGVYLELKCDHVVRWDISWTPLTVRCEECLHELREKKRRANQVGGHCQRYLMEFEEHCEDLLPLSGCSRRHHTKSRVRSQIKMGMSKEPKVWS